MPTLLTIMMNSAELIVDILIWQPVIVVAYVCEVETEQMNPVLRRNNNKSETRPGKKITKASGDVGIGYEYESDGGALTMI